MNNSPLSSGSVDWRLRREAAAEACAVLGSGKADDEHLTEVLGYAADPKWEVRKVVAESLSAFSEAHSKMVSTAMAGETHAMVEAAIRRSLSRRQLGGGGQKGHEGLLQDEFERIRTKFGQEAAEAARELAEKTTAVHIRAAVHDIRNIITYLRPTEELARDLKYRRNVNRIITGRAYLKRMLDMMDKYTAPLAVTKSSEEILDVLDESVATARGQIQEEGFDPSFVEVILQIPAGITFSVARLEIVMALSNLIKNAIESHGRKDQKIHPGRVKIGGSIDGGFIRIRIRDSGHGLSQADLDGLLAFTPGKTSKPGGSGYGLPLCNRYICAHGGRLELDSRENQGTMATVFLPLDEKSHAYP